MMGSRTVIGTWSGRGTSHNRRTERSTSSAQVTRQKRNAPLSPERVLCRKDLVLDLVRCPKDLVDLPHSVEALNTGLNRKNIILLPQATNSGRGAISPAMSYISAQFRIDGT